MSAKPPEQWLDFAAEDLAVARLVFAEEHLAHSCFLSQQCVEKAFKAYLIAKTRNYPRIHNLVDLLDLCEKVDETFSQFRPDCEVIDQYYIPTRYPAGIPGAKPSSMPNAEDVQEAMTAAEKILICQGEAPVAAST